MISKNSKRLQITLNEGKEKEKVIIDYLSNSFSETNEVKRILYEYILNQSDTKRVKEIKNKSKLLTNSKSNSKKVKENKSNLKVTTVSKSDDITVDLSQFSDEVVENKRDVKDKSEELKQKKLKALKQFI